MRATPARACGELLRFPFPAAAVLWRGVAGAWLALLGAAAGFLLWRRLAGALSPLSPLGLTLCAMCILAASGGARVILLTLPHSQRHPGVTSTLVSAAVLTLGLALSVPGSGAGAQAMLWLLLVGAEACGWMAYMRTVHRQPGTRGRVRRAADSAQPLVSEQPLLDDAILQQITLRQAAGRAEISGWLRMRVAYGQRAGVIHVAFCPPFDGVPEFEAEQLDGPPARIKAAQVLPYGARLEVKLDAPADEACSLLLRFAAVTPGPGPSGDR